MYNVFFVDVNGVRIDQFPRTNDDVVTLRPRVQNKEGNPSGSVTIYLRINSIISARLETTFTANLDVAIPTVHAVPEPGLVTIHPTSLDVDVSFKIATEVDFISKEPITKDKIDLGVPYISATSHLSEYTKVSLDNGQGASLTDFRKLSLNAVRPSRQDAIVHMDQVLTKIREGFAFTNPNAVYKGYVENLINRTTLANAIGGGTVVTPAAGDLQGWYEFDNKGYQLYVAAMPLFTYSNYTSIANSARRGQVHGIDTLKPIPIGANVSNEYGETSSQLQPVIINGRAFIARAPYYIAPRQDYRYPSTYRHYYRDITAPPTGDVIDYLFSLTFSQAIAEGYDQGYKSFHDDKSRDDLYLGLTKRADHIYADQDTKNDVFFKHKVIDKVYEYIRNSSSDMVPRYRPILQEIRNDGRGIQVIPGDTSQDPNTPEYWHTLIPGSYAALRDQMGITYTNGETIPTHPWVDRWLEVIFDTRQYFIPATAIVENLPGTGAVSMIGTGPVNSNRSWSSNTPDGKYPFILPDRRYHTSIEIMRSGFFKSFTTGVNGTKLLNVSMWDRLMGALGGTVDSWHPGFEYNGQYPLPSIKVIECVPSELTKGRIRSTLSEHYYDPVVRAEATPNSQRTINSSDGSTDRYSLRPVLRVTSPIIKMPIKTNAVRPLSAQEITKLHTQYSTHALVTLVSAGSSTTDNATPDELNKVWKFDDGGIVFNHRTAILSTSHFAAMGLFTDVPVRTDAFVSRHYKPMPRPHLYLDGEMYRLRLSKVINTSVLVDGIHEGLPIDGTSLDSFFSEEQQIKLWMNKTPVEGQVVTSTSTEMCWPTRHDSHITRDLSSTSNANIRTIGDTFFKSIRIHEFLTIAQGNDTIEPGLTPMDINLYYQGTLVGDRLPNDGNGVSGGAKIKLLGGYAQISNSILDPETHGAPFNPEYIDQADTFIQIFKDGKELLIPFEEPIGTHNSLVTLLTGLPTHAGDPSVPIPVLDRYVYIGEKWYLLRLMTSSETKAYYPPLIEGPSSGAGWSGQKIANYEHTDLLRYKVSEGYFYLINPEVTHVTRGVTYYVTMNDVYDVGVGSWSESRRYHGLFILEHMPNFVDNRDITSSYVTDPLVGSTFTSYLGALPSQIGWSSYTNNVTKVVSDTGELIIPHGRTRVKLESLYREGLLYRPWENVIAPLTNWLNTGAGINNPYRPSKPIDENDTYIYTPAIRDPVDIRRVYNIRGDESTETPRVPATLPVVTRYDYPREMMASELFLKVLSKSSHGNLGATYNPDIEYYPPMVEPSNPSLKPTNGGGFYDPHYKRGHQKVSKTPSVGFIPARDKIPLVVNTVDEVVGLVAAAFPKDQIRIPEREEEIFDGGPFGTDFGTINLGHLLKLMDLESFGTMSPLTTPVDLIQVERSKSMYLFPTKPLATYVSYLDLYHRGLVTGSPHAYIDGHVADKVTQLRDFTLTMRGRTYRLVPRVPRTFPPGVRYEIEMYSDKSVSENLKLSDFNRILMPFVREDIVTGNEDQVVRAEVPDLRDTLINHRIICQEFRESNMNAIATRCLAGGGDLASTLSYHPPSSSYAVSKSFAWLPIFEVYRVR